MLKIRFSVLALAGLSLVSAANAATILEDFSTAPQSNGWQVFGDTNLFSWNSTNQNLEVTWDSRHPNSYFYYPLGAQFTRNDDFTLEFDLSLSDIASGVEPGKTGPMQIGFGLLNFATATSTNFLRTDWGGAPNVAEFDYYPAGYYEYGGFIWDILPTTAPSFISGVNSKHYAPGTLTPFLYELPINQPIHVRLTYSALSQTAVLAVTTNGVPLGPLPELVLNTTANSQFTDADDFRVDMFSISSYRSIENGYDSVLAHGTVDNLAVNATLRPITRLTGAFTNSVWQAQFFSHSNWLYTLERTSDFQTWTPVSLTLQGTEGKLSLEDTNTVPTKAFYRVRAD